MRAPLWLPVALLAVAGCAKFPQVADRGFTRLRFRFTVAGEVNPNYLYFVAIRPLTAADVEEGGPVPVVRVGSKNGFVEGQPTRYVQFEETRPEFYTVFRFKTKAEAPDATDPNPINLGAPEIVGPVIAASGVDPREPGGGYGNTLGFDIDTRYLARTDADARAIVAIQFNLLTMNRLALSENDVGSRVMDALGDQSSVNDLTFNAFRRIFVNTSGTYSDKIGGGEPEVENDLYPGARLPDIDLTGWTLDVQTE